MGRGTYEKDRYVRQPAGHPGKVRDSPWDVWSTWHYLWKKIQLRGSDVGSSIVGTQWIIGGIGKLQECDCNKIFFAIFCDFL